MGEVRTVGDLEIDQDLDFQRRSWRFQRVGWVIMMLLMLSAAAGLLGGGPLSRGQADVPGLMRVEYERFARLETSETLTARLEPAATDGKTLRLSLDRGFLDSARISTVLPPPISVETAAGRLIYVFAVAEPRIPTVVTFNFEPQEVGIHRGLVGIETASGVRHAAVRQLVYP